MDQSLPGFWVQGLPADAVWRGQGPGIRGQGLELRNPALLLIIAWRGPI